MVAFITFVFLPSLVCSSEVYADITSAFLRVRLLLFFFFSGLHLVTCGSPFFSLHSILFVVASVLRLISFAVRFPILGTFIYSITFLHLFYSYMLLAIVLISLRLSWGFALSRL